MKIKLFNSQFFIRALAGASLLALTLIFFNYNFALTIIETTIFLALSYFALKTNYRAWATAFFIFAIAPFLPGNSNPFIEVYYLFFSIFGLIFAYISTDGYFKGTRFEKFIAKLYPNEQYVTVTKTKNISAYLGRFVETDNHPDFVFRNRETESVFAVECKWRRSFSKNAIGVEGIFWNVSHGEKYAVFAKERNMQAFIAFGIGGTPYHPETVSFVPLGKINGDFIASEIIIAHTGIPL